MKETSHSTARQPRTDRQAPSVDRQVSRYQLEAELARGGMGVVYRASDRVVGREVAYKRLIVPERITRAHATALFEREYNALAQLSHPAIVEVYEYGTDERGPRLASRARSRGSPSPCIRTCWRHARATRTLASC